MLITNVEVQDIDGHVDVRCREGVIVEVGAGLGRGDEPCLHGAGGVLLPGLHDHHMHLFALAAELESVRCGPGDVAGIEDLRIALRNAPGEGWVRAVGYHESVAGVLDRWQLDSLVSDRPVKVQHRSGKLWVVNSAGAALLSLDSHTHVPGVELDAGGRPNGRLFRLDRWMREQLAVAPAPGGGYPSLERTSHLLASRGVTGVTDTSPDNGESAMVAFAHAVQRGELLQRVRVMGNAALPVSPCAQLERGERKILLDEDNLPDWDTFAGWIAEAHGQGRAVAVHCVTPAELVLTLSVLGEVGVRPGDRIEHASLVPEDVIPLVRDAGVRVVTQPGFIYERGDQYCVDVDAAEHDHLYRCRRLLEQGIPLGGSTDAPYGEPDPWLAMRAAVKRCSPSGVTIGRGEQLSPEQALALFTCSPGDPGGKSRLVAVGESADLCLLARPWREARLRLLCEDVCATLCAGKLVYDRDAPGNSERQHASAA